jgi:hypothetical protein
MKTAYFQNFVFCLTAMIFNTSCVHYYYQPSANNVPMFKEKNEARVQLQSSGGNDLSGVDVQTAYAVGNHTALQLNFFHTGEKEQDYGVGRGNYIEAAAGYFNASHNKRWIFETYAGIGYGSVLNVYGSSDINSYSQSSKFGVTKFFAQPSFGYSSKYFSMAISSKLAVVNYNLLNSSIKAGDYSYDAADVESLKNKSFFLWEPGFIMRGGFEHFQALFQITHSVPFKTGLLLDNLNASLGIIVPFKIKSK